MDGRQSKMMQQLIGPSVHAVSQFSSHGTTHVQQPWMHWAGPNGQNPESQGTHVLLHGVAYPGP
jgi:hypothetical protein